MGATKVFVFVASVFLLCIASTQAASTPAGGSNTPAPGMMEDWKIVAIVVPCVVGGLALLICLMCCCCCQGGGGGMMCCDPNYCCGPMCDPNCCGPMCDPNCCGPMCDCNQCCGPMCGPMCDCNQCCGPNCGPMCDCNQCCGPMCDPAMCCGPQCCGPCCYVAPVTTAPVVTQYATRSQIWPQQACNYRSSPPGAIGGYGGGQGVSNVQVNGGPYGRSMDANYSSGGAQGGAQCGPCGQQGGGGYSYRY